MHILINTQHFILPTIGDHNNYSRFNQLEFFHDNVPDSEFGKIQWLYLVIATGLSDSALEKGEIEKFLSTFGHASLNKKWHSGVLKASEAKANNASWL